ncbi:MAG: HAD-IA family hydrolase [Planctomycetaceae bacterium]|nr:HAD-IA family hydrolase [Planctomycetaceae bacterium]
MTLIRAVVFDMDGIMFNTEDLFHLTGHELMRRRGKVATPELFHAMMGRRAHDAFTAMINMMQLTETIPELQEESEAIFDDLLSKHLDTMPGLHELLDTIEQQNIPKGVATSSDRRYLERLLNQFDLLPRFDMTLTAEDVTQGKPHPEIYLTAASRLGVDPHEMLVLEDSETGTRAASAAGAFAVSVPNRHTINGDFSMASMIVDTLQDERLVRLLR